MKRAITLLLLLCLIPCLLFACSAPPKMPMVTIEHTIWDIPWGIGVEEFIAKAYENTGIVFEQIKDKDGRVSCEPVEGQPISVLGYEMDMLYALFSDTGQYGVFSFSGKSSELSLEEIFAAHGNSIQTLTEQYSKPLMHTVTVLENKEFYEFPAPMKRDKLDFSALENICRGYEYVAIRTFIENITVMRGVTCREGRHTSWLSIAAWPVDEPHPLRFYHRNTYNSYTDFRKAHPVQPTATPAPTHTPTPGPVDIGL